MLSLVNRIRPYDWGSRETIARLQGRAFPTAQPEAELWIGAHPSAPSLLDGRNPLDKMILSAPHSHIGADAVDKFGPRLPYLLKVLAAERPLSLQAHPDYHQARVGYAAENRLGIPLDAPHRTYVDQHHKPELLVAMTKFEALCGFRPATRSAATLAALGIPALSDVVTALADQRLSHAVELLMNWPMDERAELVAAATARPKIDARTARLVEMLASSHPGDIGIIVALLLNHVTLEPGQAIWMPAGNLHAYLHGSGIEIMAASDNVLRGGLTSKHINIPELLRILRYEELQHPIIESVAAGPGIQTWHVPTPDFRLHRVQLSEHTTSAVSLQLAGPRTIICLSGRVSAKDDAGEIDLAPGETAFGASNAGALKLTGHGEVFIASL